MSGTLLREEPELDGIFSCVSYSKKENVLTVFQDKYGSSIPTFYAQDGPRILVSSSFSFLVSQLANRVVNYAAVREFFSYRLLIPSASTLMAGVNKLQQRQVLKVDVSARQIEVIERRGVRRTVADDAQERLIPSVTSRIEEMVRLARPKQLATTLSSGYDTNLILRTLRGVTQVPIQAFTMGGNNVNEIPHAAAITRCYERVDHITKTVPSDIINILPEIVWRYGGLIYERGIFLQYLLAKTMSEAGVKSVVLGEGADQLLDQTNPNMPLRLVLSLIDELSDTRMPITGLVTKAKDYFHPLKLTYMRFQKALPQNGRSLLRVKNPSDGILGSYRERSLEVVFKKSGMMMNSFGIMPFYPFLNRETEECGYSLGILNHRKMYYKSMVRRILGSDITGHVQNIGGATDVQYLLSDVMDHIADSMLGSNHLQRALGSDLLNLLLSDRSLYRYERYATDVFLPLLYLHIGVELLVRTGDTSCLSPTDLRLQAFV